MEHLVIRSRGAITNLWGPDLHVFVDGRRSPRTRRAQILEDWSEFAYQHEKRADHPEPIKADHYVSLGIGDSREHELHFVGANQHHWLITDEWTIFKYESRHHLSESYTRLINKQGDIYVLTLTEEKKHPRDWKTNHIATATPHISEGGKLEARSSTCKGSILGVIALIEGVK